jgi:hypothetical protein
MIKYILDRNKITYANEINPKVLSLIECIDEKYFYSRSNWNDKKTRDFYSLKLSLFYIVFPDDINGIDKNDLSQIDYQ